MQTFADVTAVTARDDGGFDVVLDPGWTIGGKPNGGYLLALLGRAAVASVDGFPHPVAASATYLRAPVPGPAVVRVRVLRSGRTAAQASAVLEQEGAPCVEALLTLAELPPQADVRFASEEPVALPPISECFALPPVAPGGLEVALMGQVEEHLDPAVLGFAMGQPSGSGELRGYLTLPGGVVEPLAVLFAVDAFPPATLELGSVGWVPTLELTCYLRAVPADGPLRVRQRARVVADGMLDEVCEVWDSTGVLVGQGTQLARVRF